MRQAVRAALGAAILISTAAIARAQDDASILGTTLPGHMTAGQKATVQVYVVNTGHDDWANPEVRLGAVGDISGDASKSSTGSARASSRSTSSPPRRGPISRASGWCARVFAGSATRAGRRSS